MTGVCPLDKLLSNKFVTGFPPSHVPPDKRHIDQSEANVQVTWSVSTNEKPCAASDRRKNIEHESLVWCHRVSQLIVKHAEVRGKFIRPEHYNFHQPPGSMVISQPSAFLTDPVLNAQITLQTDFHYLPRSLVHTNQCWLAPSVSTYFNSLATLSSSLNSFPYTDSSTLFMFKRLL